MHNPVLKQGKLQSNHDTIEPTNLQNHEMQIFLNIYTPTTFFYCSF